MIGGAYSGSSGETGLGWRDGPRGGDGGAWGRLVPHETRRARIDKMGWCVDVLSLHSMHVRAFRRGRRKGAPKAARRLADARGARPWAGWGRRPGGLVPVFGPVMGRCPLGHLVDCKMWCVSEMGIRERLLWAWSPGQAGVDACIPLGNGGRGLDSGPYPADLATMYCARYSERVRAVGPLDDSRCLNRVWNSGVDEAYRFRSQNDKVRGWDHATIEMQVVGGRSGFVSGEWTGLWAAGWRSAVGERGQGRHASPGCGDGSEAGGDGDATQWSAAPDPV